MPLAFSHNAALVAASFAIALMAGFAGLSVTRGASKSPPATRKALVALSSVLLGGGIWSMHFVAMLGLQLPVLFFYDALTTLISALTGILFVGLSLVILHFRDRTSTSIILSGLILGGGILCMHFIGMSGMEACRAVYTPGGIALSVALSLILGTLAVWVAYGERTRRNILLGTLCFALAVVSLHFVAIANTSFFAVPLENGPTLALSNEALAMIVTLCAFAICGGSLLAGATFFPGASAPAGPPVEHASPPDDPGVEIAPPLAPPAEAKPPLVFRSSHDPAPVTIPYEKNGRTLFAEAARVVAFRAEGHYTFIYLEDERVLCPWSISEAEQRLEGSAFLRAHRSYLINPAFVTEFERRKDTGVTFFHGVSSLEKAPVSRSRLPEVRDALGL
ncbi:MAG: MHYT domain-containing protein [Pseudomonadota bacterium]